MSGLQHFRIYGGAILTSTRGLWTPVKCYFVQSSKWSDHKPSNRGIQSVFLLWPAPVASSQDSEDRPPVQTCLETKPRTSYSTIVLKIWISSRFFFIGSGPLDSCFDHSVKLLHFLDVFVWTRDHTGSDNIARSTFAPLAICVCLWYVFDILALLVMFILTEVNMYIDSRLGSPHHFFILTLNRRLNSIKFSEYYISACNNFCIVCHYLI